MQNGIKSIENVIESTLLKSRTVSSTPNSTGPNQTHLGNIGNDGEFKLVPVFPKQFPEVGFLGFRSDCGSDGVSFLEEDIDDTDGDETVRAGDEDFASWSDDWHVSSTFRRSDGCGGL